MSRRFVCNFYITNNNQLLYCDIPYNISIDRAKFMVSGVSGQMAVDGSYVGIFVPELTTPNIFNTVNNSYNMIADTVLGTVATKSTNRSITSIDLGYELPTGINRQSASFTFIIKDETGAEYADADIDWMNIQITFWNINS
jgi:hypothetical protein